MPSALPALLRTPGPCRARPGLWVIALLLGGLLPASVAQAQGARPKPLPLAATEEPAPAATPAPAAPPAPAAAPRWPATAPLIDARAEATPPGVHATPEALAQALTAGLTQDVEKLYALYRWVTRHIRYDTAAYFAGDLRNAAGSANAFSRGQAVCDGYAELLQVMAAAVGLKLEKVVGYGKGLSHTDGRLPEQTNHAWNAVQLGGRWYLMDATWDAGNVNPGTQQFTRNEKGFRYFLADPEYFSTSHFPAEARWQLQREKMDFARFLQLAKIRPDIGAFAFDVRAYRERQQGGGTAPLAFDFGPAVQHLTAHMAREGRRLEGQWTLLQRGPEGPRLLVAAPAPGDYELTVFAPRQPGDTVLEQLLEYRVALTGPGPYAQGFAATFREYGQRAVDLQAPLQAVLPAGKPVGFVLRVPDAVEVFLIHGSQLYTKLPAQGEGRYGGDLVLGAGVATVYARFDPQSPTGQALLRYRVE